MVLKRSPHWLRLASLLMAGLGLPGGAVRAAEPNWPSAPYRYIVVDQDLRTLLTQFGANMGSRVALSDAVQGRVRGRLPPLPPRQFLDHVAQAYGLDWYYEGSVLSISADAEAETRFVKLQGLDFDTLRRGLQAAGLFDRRFVLRPGPASDVALVSGPPRYVALVAQSAAMMSPGANASPKLVAAGDAGAATLRVFRGAATTEVRFP